MISSILICYYWENFEIIEKIYPFSRIWNSQLISYAGYKISDTEIIGDAKSIDFTEICEHLGWKGQRTDFDILPLVLQANGQKPELYEIPKEIIKEVDIVHTK